MDGRTFNILLYSLFFLLCVVFSGIINGLFLRFSRNLGMRNVDPTMIRWGPLSKPSVGGFSFYIIFLISVSTFGLFPFAKDFVFNKQLIGLLLASSLGFLVGLADDAYNTKPFLKFGGQIACSLILVATGTLIQITPFYYLNILVTVLWVAGIMNSINMLDNMDGITAGISITIFGAMIIISRVGHYLFDVQTFLLLGAIGSLLGFLYYNWHPSKLYMGDTGSQFLGVLLGGMSIMHLWNYRDAGGPEFQFRQFALPLLVFAVPLIDTITVSVRRIMRGQSPFVGGRDHTTHHLAYLGFSDSKVAVILISFSVFFGICGFLFRRFYFISPTFFTIGAFVLFAISFFVMQFFYQKAKKKIPVKNEENNG